MALPLIIVWFTVWKLRPSGWWDPTVLIRKWVTCDLYPWQYSSSLLYPTYPKWQSYFHRSHSWHDLGWKKIRGQRKVLAYITWVCKNLSYGKDQVSLGENIWLKIWGSDSVECTQFLSLPLVWDFFFFFGKRLFLSSIPDPIAFIFTLCFPRKLHPASFALEASWLPSMLYFSKLLNVLHLGAVGGKSYGSLLINIPLYPTSYSLEHLFTISFMLGVSMYSVSCNLSNSPVQ